MNKVEDVFSEKICSRIDDLYYGVNDRSKAQQSLDILKAIEGTLQEFRMEANKRGLDKTLNIQIATQFKNAATQFLHLEAYFNELKGGKTPSIGDDLAKKYVSNLHLIFNSFKELAKEIDRGHNKID